MYQKALAFVFPSIYEGFGFPILEAFANKCPVILNNSSSFPEIAENCALYFESNDPNSLENALENVLDNEKLRSALSEAGSERLKDFSWKKSAEKTKLVYNSCL